MDVTESTALTLSESLHAMRAALECPQIAQFPAHMLRIAEKLATAQRRAETLRARQTRSATVAAVAPLPVLATDLAAQFEAFRREFGAVIAFHGRLLNALEIATGRAEPLQQAHGRLVTALARAGEIIADVSLQ